MMAQRKNEEIQMKSVIMNLHSKKKKTKPTTGVHKMLIHMS